MIKNIIQMIGKYNGRQQKAIDSQEFKDFYRNFLDNYNSGELQVKEEKVKNQILIVTISIISLFILFATMVFQLTLTMFNLMIFGLVFFVLVCIYTKKSNQLKKMRQEFFCCSLLKNMNSSIELNEDENSVIESYSQSNFPERLLQKIRRKFHITRTIKNKDDDISASLVDFIKVKFCVAGKFENDNLLMSDLAEVDIFKTRVGDGGFFFDNIIEEDKSLQNSMGTNFFGAFVNLELMDYACYNELMILKKNTKLVDGYKEIEIDNPSFNEIFKVYAKNDMVFQSWLSSEFIEKLVELYYTYNIEFEVSIVKNNIYVRLLNRRLFADDIKEPLSEESVYEEWEKMVFINNLLILIKNEIKNIGGRL